MDRQPFSIRSLCLLPGSSEPAERKLARPRIYKRFPKATLPSTSHSDTEDPRLHAMPARQAALEGIHTYCAAFICTFGFQDGTHRSLTRVNPMQTFKVVTLGRTHRIPWRRMWYQTKDRRERDYMEPTPAYAAPLRELGKGVTSQHTSTTVLPLRGERCLRRAARHATAVKVLRWGGSSRG